MHLTGILAKTLNVTWRTIPCRVVLCVTFNVCAKSDKDGFDYVSQDTLVRVEVMMVIT